MNHVQQKIPACLDGVLPEVEAAAVRAHCEVCPECGRVWHETQAVWEELAAAPAPHLAHSVWPALADRLVHRPRRWQRLSYTGLAMAATAGGLAIGLWFGQPHLDGGESDGWSTLIEEGALLVEGSAWTLDRIYLSAGSEEGGEGP